tara:strand:+ start:1629 stop:4130 length:2502 start_codon:yes stop_codon:yes gene_type:complete
MKHILFWIIFSYSFFSCAQKLIVIDSEKNPISNVSAFNLSKTKSALSNADGIINLSRFLAYDTVCFQHPNYKLKKVVKANINVFVELEIEYNMLNDVVINDQKNVDNITNVAEKKIYITKEHIEALNAPTTAEILEKNGGVSVQRSQMGGGSPNIRGFEANKVLLVLDGVRLNNAIYRSGHLQNIITIDDYILENIEIIFGPSSVLYGSDALGGTVNMNTHEVFFRSKPKWSGRLSSNYNSAYNGFKNNASIIFESGKYSTITSFSFKQFGDLKMGDWRPHEYANWGLAHHYIDSDNNIVCNSNPNIQKGIGYSQYDIFNKMIFKLSDNSRITSNIQYSTSSNIPRFDKLNDGDDICSLSVDSLCLSGKDLKFHSYYYGPQERLFSSVKFSFFDNNDLYFDRADLILGYQKIKESRHKWYLDDFLDYLNTPDSYDHPTYQYESVNVYSFNASVQKGNWSFGSETIYNDVNSETTPNEENLWGIGDTRYPPNGSTLFSTAYYLNILQPISNRLQVEGGVRYTFSQIKGSFPDSLRRPLLPIEGLELSSNSSVLSGNIKFLYYPNDRWKVSSVTSKGFHSPNVDDMLKVFKKGSNITIPNIDLKTEHSLSQEISVTKRVFNNISVYGVGFSTLLNNAIIKDSIQVNLNPDLQGDPFLVNQILYDDEMVYTFANQNSDSPITIYGITIGINAIINNFQLKGDFNITRGVNAEKAAGPIAHIPPNFGRIEVLQSINKWQLRALCIYSGSKDPESFDEAGIDNLDETPYLGLDPETGGDDWAGLPSWFILNFGVQYEVSKNIQLNIGIDNILNAHYKTFSSGISAPGRSFVFSAKYIF